MKKSDRKQWVKNNPAYTISDSIVEKGEAGCYENEITAHISQPKKRASTVHMVLP